MCDVPDSEIVRKDQLILDDIVYPFDRPLTLISVFNIVYSTFNSFRTQEQGQEATKKFREEKLHFNKEIQATKDVLRKQSDHQT